MNAVIQSHFVRHSAFWWTAVWPDDILNLNLIWKGLSSPLSLSLFGNRVKGYILGDFT